jgi:hypothetical protein
MPAVQLSRLKLQAAKLGEFYAQPAVFVRQYHNLLEFYADRTLRQSQPGTHLRLLPQYNVPVPVLQQVSAELLGQAAQYSTQQTLDLLDTLWQDGYYESRMLAAAMLTTAAPDGEEIKRRLLAWVTPSEDRQIVQVLLDNGQKAFEMREPRSWIELIHTWLSDESIEVQSLGLLALNKVAADPGFENLPRIFDLIDPLIQSAPVMLYASLADVIATLAHRSPVETSFMLRHTLISSPEPAITRLIRRCIPYFSEEEQAKLRSSLLNRVKANRQGE